MALYTTIIPSPLGDLTLIADDTHLRMLEFSDNPELASKIEKIKTSSTLKLISRINPIIEQTILELGEYFEGKRKTFSIAISVNGTVFQKKAWQGLTLIPYGETRCYLEQATLINNPKAVRAIGGANHNNPIVMIIPCHRVIGKSGKLIGYGGGLQRKIWLLNHEKKYK